MEAPDKTLAVLISKHLKGDKGFWRGREGGSLWVQLIVGRGGKGGTKAVTAHAI